MESENEHDVTSKPPLTAAVIVIGNEILSGKTQDQNLQFIAQELARLGIVLVEARVIRDDKEAIVRAVIECSLAFDYLFTTGGIGPTHDDITAESVAKAFGTTLALNEEAAKLIGGGARDHPRMRMARIPVGASLIRNSVSKAPGFRIKNTFVLAGVPDIARAMFDSLKNELQRGDEIVSVALDVFLRESEIAIIVGREAFNNLDVEIGSYPFHRDGVFGTNIVVRGTNLERIKQVREQIYQQMDALGGRPRRV